MPPPVPEVVSPLLIAGGSRPGFVPWRRIPNLALCRSFRALTRLPGKPRIAARRWRVAPYSGLSPFAPSALPDIDPHLHRPAFHPGPTPWLRESHPPWGARVSSSAHGVPALLPCSQGDPAFHPAPTAFLRSSHAPRGIPRFIQRAPRSCTHLTPSGRACGSFRTSGAPTSFGRLQRPLRHCAPARSANGATRDSPG